MSGTSREERWRMFNRIYEEYDEGEEIPHIEGLIVRKKNGEWVAPLADYNGKIRMSRVDYCPWCGEEITGEEDHDHEC